jgi:catalase
MASDLKASAEPERPRLSPASTPARFALIGVLLAAVAGTFGYLGGWFTPGTLTPARFVDGFEQVNGPHPGFRRNHAKGVGVIGTFASNGNGVRLSKAAVFQPGDMAVIGRFSLGGGHPDAADSPDSVRGLGLQFNLPDGEQWRTSMINLPVFLFRTPEAFFEQMLASKPDPATGKPDPDKMKEFFARHPESAKALEVIKSQPFSSGFENSTFRALHAYRFINATGESTPVRWWLKPEQSFEPASATPAAQDKNYLFDALIAVSRHQKLRWHLMVTVGLPGDSTSDPTLPWPDAREQVNVGTLTLEKVGTDETSTATDINFDPLVLPAGMAPSDDPLLSARSAIYSQSFTRRAGEKKPANTSADVRKGE